MALSETRGRGRDSGRSKKTDVLPRVGRAIRRLRKEQSFSLQKLSELSGVSVGMLSQIERDVANPSLKVLTRIRDALDAPVSALFEEVVADPPDPNFVRRASQRPRLDLGFLTKELLSAGAGQNLQLMILHIPPRGTSGEQPLSYPAEKGGLILDGELLLKVGEQEAHLFVGDSFVFDSSQQHGFRNPGDKETKVLWVIGKVAVDRHL